MHYEEKYMFRCLQLARLGAGFTAPNPLVGAVVVYQNSIIGEGYHHFYGNTHAEPNAIRAVKDQSLLKDATLYVNLEPCSHFGKTPPCANLIIEKGIPRVVIGTADPNPKVAGRGITLLREAGIDVITDVLAEACIKLNKRFFIWQNENRPYILLKWAQTADGFVDIIRTDNTESPLLISNEITQMLTHKTRSKNQAIMVSTNTAVLDNPKLTVRHWTGRDPVRIVLDRTGRIPASHHLLDDSSPTLVFTETEKISTPKTKYIRIDFSNNVLNQILKAIADRNIHSVLVEGGPTLLNSFIKAGLWDQAQVEVSDFTCGHGVKAPQLNMVPHSIKTYDKHHVYKYVNQNKCFTNPLTT